MNAPDPQSLQGRVALITGANTGIGLVTARELATRGAHVFIACRSLEKGRVAVDEIRRAVPNARPELLALDLGDFHSVRACANAFLARNLPLHLLINNAGLAGARGITTSGFELAFGTNHVGPFLFTQLLLDHIKGFATAAAPARIVTVASRAHTRVAGIPWADLQKPTISKTGLPEYGVSKLANVLFSAELARKLAGSHVTTYALHPGVVATDVWREVPRLLQPIVKLFMINAEQGAATTLHCATSTDVAAHTGLYYDKCRIKEPTKIAQDTALAAELWWRSEKWVNG